MFVVIFNLKQANAMVVNETDVHSYMHQQANILYEYAISVVKYLFVYRALVEDVSHTRLVRFEMSVTEHS